MRPAEHVMTALADAAGRDPRVWVIDGDLGDCYGLDAAAPRLGERLVQAGIAEQTMVSMAAGLAACGARPWVFSFAAFLCARAYDQIRVGVSQTRLPVVLVGSHAGACVGKNGKTHAMLNDVALLATLPGVEVWAPADGHEAAALVPRLLGGERPAYIRLPRAPQPALPLADGGASVRRSGGAAPVALVGSGLGTQWAFGAQRVARARGIELPVVHVARLAPFPEAELAAATAGAVTLVTVEDHTTAGGLADLVRRHLPDRRVRACGWPPSWPGASGEADELRRAHGLDDAALAAACLEELR